MTSTNNRTINGYETIDGELVLSEITNQVLATDSDGLVYGINNYISNLFAVVNKSSLFSSVVFIVFICDCISEVKFEI